MSYSDPCRGDCGANHWPDCSPECSSRQSITYSKEQLQKWEEERLQREKDRKEICDVTGHDWEYTFIIYQCKRCKETSDY